MEKEDVLQMAATNFIDDAPMVNLSAKASVILKMIQENEEHTIYVVDETNKLVGMITDIDILAMIASKGVGEKIVKDEATAVDLMKKLDVEKDKTISSSSDSLEKVINKLNKSGKKVIPVVNSLKQPIGQITRQSVNTGVEKLFK
jgi:predicted transcriptional regulator